MNPRRTLSAFIAAAATISMAASAAVPTTTPAGSNDLDHAYAESQKSGKPILAFVGGRTAAWDEPEIAALAGKWVIAVIDAKDTDLIRALAVADMPAVRALTPGGHVVARLDGTGDHASIVAWLQRAEIAARPMAPAGVKESLEALRSTDPATRQAAIRSLHAASGEAAPAVIELLQQKELSTRTAAADLLTDWGAPLDGIDPWDRQTVTPERIRLLAQWAADVKKSPATTRAVVTGSHSIDDELTALIAAPTILEARALRERIATNGAAIKAIVARRLHDEHAPAARVRLSALRYRLAASDALLQKWPGGVDLLATDDAVIRRSAMATLASLAGTQDSPLLLELFASDDALVREQALRILKNAGGARESLTSLLHDPEPNVRAAVLKSLAEEEKPDAAFAAELATYAQSEMDPDLVVHAIGVLKTMDTAPAINGMIQLLSHKEWRVRAEAAAGFWEKFKSHSSDRDPTLQSAAVTALTARLDDDEPFVVNQAVNALLLAGSSSATEKLMSTAENKPALAADILKGISSNEPTVALFAARIEKLAHHERPDVRAAAFNALADGLPAAAGKYAGLAIRDKEERVREVGFAIALEAIEKLRPEGTVRQSTFLGFGSRDVKVDTEKWIADFRAGKGRAKWVEELIAPAEIQVAGGSGMSKASAAMILMAVGKAEVALPVLCEASHDANLASIAIRSLGWADKASQDAIALELRTSPARSTLSKHLRYLKDPSLAPLVWDVVLEEGDVEYAVDSLTDLYMGENRYRPTDLPAGVRTTVVTKIRTELNATVPARRRVALELLSNVDPADAKKRLRQIIDDPKESPGFRLAAVSTFFDTDNDDDSARYAVDILQAKVAKDLGAESLAVYQLAVRANDHVSFTSGDVDQTVQVKSPPGLTPADVKPLLQHADTDTAAYAGYLLATMKDPSGIDLVKAQWNAGSGRYNSWIDRYVKAIAALNDGSRVPDLTLIYETYRKDTDSNWQMRQFYWTIRSMTGDAILKLRKRMRDEVGMQNLTNS